MAYSSTSGCGIEEWGKKKTKNVYFRLFAEAAAHVGLGQTTSCNCQLILNVTLQMSTSLACQNGLFPSGDRAVGWVQFTKVLIHVKMRETLESVEMQRRTVTNPYLNVHALIWKELYVSILLAQLAVFPRQTPTILTHLYLRRQSEFWFTTRPTWTRETRTGRRRCTLPQPTTLCAVPRWSSRSWAASTCRTAAGALRCITLPSMATLRYGPLSVAGPLRPAPTRGVIRFSSPSSSVSDGEPPAQ